MGKRLFDIILSFSGLMFLSPLLLIVVGLILIWDGTPVLFRQLRVGKNGLEFILNKFRTMIPLQKGSHSSFDAGDGKRVTRLGSFLRKTKFDELPQLWNVLIGDISFVGPRPEVRKWVDAYPERWAKILSVKPGITDPASIYYRNEEELLAKANEPEAYYRDVILPHKLDLYEEYVRTQSFWGDIRLIFKTILVVLFPRRFSAHNDAISEGKINSISKKDL